jgi:hypothetical protein
MANSKWRIAISKWSLVFLVLAVLLVPFDDALAQAEEGVWGEPVNVSRSGAAEQPQIVAAPDGRVQAFWWDRFDGLMSARYDGETWSAPISAPIIFTEVITRGQEVELEFTPLDLMPTIVGDGRGWAYAFWVGEEDEETGGTPLMASQMPLGSNDWSEPGVLAESASVFEVAAAPSGGLTVAYVRLLSNSAFPAGLYVKRSFGGGGGWGAPMLVQASFYLRLLTPETVHLRVADDGGGTIRLAWDDPYLDQALYARSDDGGVTWSAPEPLGDPDNRPARPRVLPLPGGGALRMWEATGMGSCMLTQQQSEGGDPESWSAAQQVMEGVGSCPQRDLAWLIGDGLLWLWGRGSGSLTLAGWDAENERWSEPRSFSFRFQDPETERWIGLDGLQVVPAGDALVVVGIDLAGSEVWALTAQVGALELAFAPPSPWTAAVRLSSDGAAAGQLVAAGQPTVALDGAGSIHVVWSEADGADGPGTSLWYARWDASAGTWSRAVEIVPGVPGEEVARQPALLADAAGVLHLVWSGGAQGQILYSRAKIGEAAAASGWSSPQPLPAPGPAGSSPRIVQDAAGRLLVAYTVPLNEGRGVYLVRSDDGGETWSEPSAIFDAAAAGWAVVDHVALVASPEGALHVAWVRGALPDGWMPQGIYYTRSGDGSSWSEPWEVTGAGYDWPRLALAGGQVRVLFARVDDGGVYHRASDAREVAFGTPTRVPGLEQAGGPFGLAADGESLHLVGAVADQGVLLYTSVPITGDFRWGGVETLSLGAEIEGGGGAAAAVSPGGRLAVAVQAVTGTGAGPSIWAAARAIPPVASPAQPEAAAPTPVPGVEPASTSLPTAGPTPTLDLAAEPPPASDTARLGLVLGGGLAAVIVVGVMAVWGVRRRQ